MFDIFKFRVDTNNITNLNDLKQTLLKEKKIHTKYRLKIKTMNEKELKTFLYLKEYTEKEFIGVGMIFIEIYNKNLLGLIQYIIRIDIPGINILRIMIATLEKYEKYEKKFLKYLMNFKKNYDIKFKKLLFELSKKNYIDKLDVIDLFIKLLRS